MGVTDLSADIGLVAVVVATLNICIGLLIALRYSPVRCWPHRRLNIFRAHTWTAYFLVVAIILHPFVLLFSSTRRFRVQDIALPLWSQIQPVENTFGAAGLYLVGLVMITSHLRQRMKRVTWKRFHYLVYVASVAILVHGLFTDPRLNSDGKPVDLLDGEKVLVEVCAFVIFAVAVYGAKCKHRRDGNVSEP